MNERIRELAEQATTRIDPIAHDGVCWDFDKEKFAQLIVQEYENEIWNCVMVESAGSDDKFLIRGIVRSALHDAKQHFGVEL
jgi:hypothetical protein